MQAGTHTADAAVRSRFAPHGGSQRLVRALDLYRHLRATAAALFGAELHRRRAHRNLGALNRATLRDIGID